MTQVQICFTESPKIATKITLLIEIQKKLIDSLDVFSTAACYTEDIREYGPLTIISYYLIIHGFRIPKNAEIAPTRRHISTQSPNLVGRLVIMTGLFAF